MDPEVDKKNPVRLTGFRFYFLFLSIPNKQEVNNALDYPNPDGDHSSNYSHSAPHYAASSVASWQSGHMVSVGQSAGIADKAPQSSHIWPSIAQ